LADDEDAATLNRHLKTSKRHAIKSGYAFKPFKLQSQWNFVVLVGEFSHGEDFAQHHVVLTPLLLSPLRSSRHGPDRMSRVCSQYMLLIAEFVVDLLCTGRMSETE
jgi:hypothetical protein